MTSSFTHFAAKESIDGLALREAIDRAARGLIDADLGGGVIKQRVARPGQGRSAGFRTVIAFRAGARAFFIHGFAKSRRANVSKSELAKLKLLASVYFELNESQIAKQLSVGELKRIPP